jgi:hypothetical protein
MLAGSEVASVRNSPAEPDTDLRISGLRQLGRILGSIVAPTTLITSLLYYFGWSFAFSFFDNFGVSYTVVDLGTAEYLQRAVVALYLPAAVLASAALLVLWGHAALRARLAAGSDPRLIRVLILVTASALHLQRTRAAQKLGRPGRTGLAAVAEWAIVFALVGLGLFWAAGDYSVAVANTQAYKFVQELPSSPRIVLYSEKSLSLNAPSVQETRCQAAEAAYHYRYDGLKLMVRSGEFAPSSNRAIAVHPAC